MSVCARTTGVCIPVYNASDPSTFDDAGKPLRPDNFCQEAHSDSTHMTQHYTMVFNVFVLMQIFNEINSRKVPPPLPTPPHPE
jgi:hypothetical protein